MIRHFIEWRNYVIVVLTWLLMLEIIGEGFVIFTVWAIMIGAIIGMGWGVRKFGIWLGARRSR